MDIISIGKEAVYRRLRGEVPFTFYEVSLLSQSLGISLDQIVGTNRAEGAVFNLNVSNNMSQMESYHDIIPSGIINYLLLPKKTLSRYSVPHVISFRLHFILRMSV